MTAECIERRGTGYGVIGKRVPLESIVYAYLTGYTPSAIHEAFPTLTPNEVIGAIDFYEGHKDDVEATFAEDAGDLERLREAARKRYPELYRKLEETRRSLAVPKQK